jgi:hypothetical protein
MVPIEATVMPLPTELTTPPVIKISFDMQGNQLNPKGVSRQTFVGNKEKGMHNN